MLVTKKQYESALSGEIILMTPTGHEAIQARLEDLKLERLKLEGELGYAAQDYPDLRENAIYGDLAIKIQLDLPRQRDDLREMLQKAVVISGLSTDKAGLGSRFEAHVGSESKSFWLVGPAEVAFAASNGDAQAVSYLSPLGSAIWGAKAGEVRRFAANGYDQTVTIIAFLGV